MRRSPSVKSGTSKGCTPRARAGLIKGFTGIDDPYEVPEQPEVVCHTDQETIRESTDKVIDRLVKLGYLTTARKAR